MEEIQKEKATQFYTSKMSPHKKIWRPLFSPKNQQIVNPI